MACEIGADFAGDLLLDDNTMSLCSLIQEREGNEATQMWAASAAVWVRISHHNEHPQPLIGLQISEFSKPTSSAPVVTAKMASGKFFA